MATRIWRGRRVRMCNGMWLWTGWRCWIWQLKVSGRSVPAGANAVPLTKIWVRGDDSEQED